MILSYLDLGYKLVTWLNGTQLLWIIIRLRNRISRYIHFILSFLAQWSLALLASFLLKRSCCQATLARALNSCWTNRKSILIFCCCLIHLLLQFSAVQEISTMILLHFQMTPHLPRCWRLHWQSHPNYLKVISSIISAPL